MAMATRRAVVQIEIKNERRPRGRDDGCASTSIHMCTDPETSSNTRKTRRKKKKKEKTNERTKEERRGWATDSLLVLLLPQTGVGEERRGG